MNTSKYIHERLRSLFGSASNYFCPCGEPARDWAYQFTGDPELRNPDGSGPHSVDPNDYLPMCRPCHRALDIENDPTMVEKMRDGSILGGVARAERMQLDPEFAAEMRDALKRGRQVAAERFRTDPELKERTREAQRNSAKIRRQCVECGKISSPGGIGSHQRWSGHSGTKGLDATG